MTTLQSPGLLPSIECARSIAESALSASVERIERFNTGNHHFVYDVHLSGGKNVVVRIARLDERKALEGALYWSDILRPRGVPLPEVLQADITCSKFPFPYMILQRFPGTDLKYVYSGLSISRRRILVSELVKIQNLATALPQGKGFGYATHMDGPFRHQSWQSLIADAISRTRSRVAQGKLFSLEGIDRLETIFKDISGYLKDVPPTPFLHDMTSKNVLMHNGNLSGIIDVDDLCFGDPLYLPGLIQAGFLADRLGTDYIGYWKEALSLSRDQARIVDFYAAQCLASIMSDIGLQKNTEQQSLPDAAEIGHLGNSLSLLLKKL